MSPVLYCTDIADSTSGCRQFSVLEYFRVSSSIKVPAEFVNNKKQRGSSELSLVPTSCQFCLQQG